MYCLGMKTIEAIQHYGSIRKLAKALGITRQAVQCWGEYPPRGSQCELQIITQGVLKADLTPRKKVLTKEK